MTEFMERTKSTRALESAAFAGIDLPQLTSNLLGVSFWVLGHLRIRTELLDEALKALSGLTGICGKRSQTKPSPGIWKTSNDVNRCPQTKSLLLTARWARWKAARKA